MRKTRVWSTPDEFLKAFSDATERHTGVRRELYAAQRDAVIHDRGPLAIMAGPGTGKTETLVLRTLRLLLVDGLAPQSIILTTFTEKAARELIDRLSCYLRYLEDSPEFIGKDRPDLTRLWTGTLHSLALRLLREFSPAHEALRVVDELGAQLLFLKTLRPYDVSGVEADALHRFVTGRKPRPEDSRIKRAGVLKRFLDRLIEDNVELEDFWLDGDRAARSRIRKLFENYDRALPYGAVDFARLQKSFLDFLRSDQAEVFLCGRPDRILPGIKQVIVDEYQDTNFVQEAIYFALAGPSKNLIVVGDDDQALYRFRGASVELLVRFDERCIPELGVWPHKIYLSENRRSPSTVVNLLNTYLRSVGGTANFDTSRDKQKPAMEHRATTIATNSAAVAIVRMGDRQIANIVADTIKDLYSGGVISDLRQVALLAPTTRKASIVSEYEAAFSLRGIPTYNARNGYLTDDPAISLLLGSLMEILDPERKVEGLGGEVGLRVGQGPRTMFSQHRSDLLGRFVIATRDSLHSMESQEAVPSLLDIVYRCLAYEPFMNELSKSGGTRDAVAAWRLARFTRIVSVFQDLHAPAGIPLAQERHKRFWVRRGRQADGRLVGPSPYFVRRFFRDLVATLSIEGFDDLQSGNQNFPIGAVPILTIHQAKGLEFSVVFVCGIRRSFGAGSEHYQEDLLAPYRARSLTGLTSRPERAQHDTIRKFFVAYSRAKWLLVLCATKGVWESVDQKAYPHLPREFKEGVTLL